MTITMGWETCFMTPIRFNKETYNNEYQVRDELDDRKEAIERYKKQLAIMVALHPKDLIEKDCEGAEFDIEQSISNKLDRWWELFEEDYCDKINLEYAIENFHRRAGDFVKPDLYVKFIGETDSVFEKDKVYHCNKEKDWNGDMVYHVRKDWEVFIPFKEEAFQKYFVESTEDEWDKQFRH